MVSSKAVNVAGAAISCGFAAIALVDYLQTGMWLSVLFVALQVQGAVLFLVRAGPQQRAAGFAAPAVAFASFCWPYLYARADAAWFAPSSVLIWAGAIACLLATFSLGRAFAIVPAYRGLRTGGAYRLIRHPIYASYLLMDLGTVLAAWSAWNVLVAVTGLGLLLARIEYEERLLAADPAFAAYRERVRYRLAPGVY